MGERPRWLVWAFVVAQVVIPAGAQLYGAVTGTYMTFGWMMHSSM